MVDAGSGVKDTIDQLDDGVDYRFEVRAVNADGDSPWSNVGSVSTPANRLPVFTEGATASRSLPENSPEDTNVGNPIAATDQDNDTREYSITGTNSGKFTVSPATGQILAGEHDYDFETTTSYTFTLKVVDRHDGEDMISVTVTISDVDEPPEAPTKPGVSAGAAPRSLTITWTAPANTGPDINGYDLQYRQGTSGNWTPWIHTGVNQTAIITGLVAGKTHQVQVKARNPEGESEWSSSGQGSTDPNRPPAFDDDQGSSATSRSITETLGDALDTGRTVGTPVTATDADGGTPTYSLGRTDDDSFAINSTTGQISARSGKKYDHEAQSSHSVTVTATDGQEQPLGTRSISVTIDITDIDEPPRKMDATTFDSTQRYSTRIGWTAPTNTGRPPITGYQVRYGAGTDVSTHTVKDTASNLLELVVDQLDDDQTYRFQVRAKNDEGWGTWSEFAAVTTLANQAPTFTDGASATRDLPENSAAGTHAGSPVDATDGDDDTVTYSITGMNSGEFTIESGTGQLQAGDHDYNYESTTIYTLTLKVEDGHEGTDTIVVTVNISDVTEPPARPDSPTSSHQSLTSITFQWQKPENTGPAITDYDAQWRKGTSGDWTDVEDITLTRSATLENLDQNETYQLQVRADNPEGTSGWSHPGSSTTNENSAPSFNEGENATRSVPENTSTAANAGTPLAVTDADLSDGGELEYSITTASVPFTIDDSNGQLKTVAGADYDHEAKSSHEFNVQVQDGQGGSDSITVTVSIIDVSEPPGKPDAPTSSSSTINSITIGWTEPDNTGPAIIDYDVRYSTDGTRWEPHDFTGTELTTTVTGLDRGTSHEFQVRATNPEGTGNWSESGVHSTTPNSPPALPSGFSTTLAIAIPEDTAGGSSIGPELEINDPDGDTIAYTLGGDDAILFTVDPQTGELSTAASTQFNYEETPNSYSITVTGDDDEGGEIDVAININITDVEEPPGTPAAPGLTSPDSTSLEISWTAPDNSGPPITGYNVRYGRSAAGPWTDPGHTGAGTAISIASLTPGTTYWAQVQATNDEGTEQLVTGPPTS